jgi:hypothetical protein
MAKVNLLMLDPSRMHLMYSHISEQDCAARNLLLEGGQYTVKTMADSDDTPEAIADEMFDLTNNPSRQEEREEKYGRGRSLSVGDIVQVGGELMLCCSMGWETL